MLGSLIAIWATCAALFLCVVLAGGPRPDIAASLRWITLISFSVLAILVVGRDRLPAWAPDLCAYLLITIVGWLVVTYRDPASPWSFVYLWLSVHSFYFLPWRRAAPQVAYVGLNYAISLRAVAAFAPGVPFPLARWVITVATTVVICTTVALLRRDIDRLVRTLSGMATTDVLTGLLNRRAYDELIEVEIARSDRAGQPLTLVLGDLDHFKAVNDRLGHRAGDAVLRRVGEHLLRSGRRTDIAARLGGEEFALLLPATDTRGGFLVAERVRLTLNARVPGGATPVTMSFGVATYPDDAADAGALFAAADAALMVAKAQGRDRSVSYEGHMEAPGPGRAYPR